MRFLLPNSFNCLLSIVVTAPVNASLFFWNIPVTTTSLSLAASSSIITVAMTVLDCEALTVFRCSFIPMKEKTRVTSRLVGNSTV